MSMDQEASSSAGDRYETPRRSNKPLMERKRRARINNCLSQLKGLLMQDMKKESTHVSKFEKAEILEMTVHKLNKLRSNTDANQTGYPAKICEHPRYRDGFSDCIKEAVNFLSSRGVVNQELRARMVSHLNSYFRRLCSVHEKGPRVLPAVRTADDGGVAPPTNNDYGVASGGVPANSPLAICYDFSKDQGDGGAGDKTAVGGSGASVPIAFLLATPLTIKAVPLYDAGYSSSCEPISREASSARNDGIFVGVVSKTSLLNAADSSTGNEQGGSGSYSQDGLHPRLVWRPWGSGEG